MSNFNQIDLFQRILKIVNFLEKALRQIWVNYNLTFGRAEDSFWNFSHLKYVCMVRKCFEANFFYLLHVVDYQARIKKRSLFLRKRLTQSWPPIVLELRMIVIQSKLFLGYEISKIVRYSIYLGFISSNSILPSAGCHLVLSRSYSEDFSFLSNAAHGMMEPHGECYFCQTLEKIRSNYVSVNEAPIR